MTIATPGNTKLILASSSRYRKALLQRLCIEFDTYNPEVDESPLADETAEQLAARLSFEKAKAAAVHFPDSLIIGSDQVALLADTVLNKPGSIENAKQQLRLASGNRVRFITGVCLYNGNSGNYQLDTVNYEVHFKQLTENQIGRYISLDNPLDCAGSFKWESLGISLFERMSGDDVTALEGLPLIRLIDMLQAENLHIP